MSQETVIYTLLVGRERFELTKEQLESDPGNYFATYFLGDFQEATEGKRELRLHKEPKLFKLIHAHLQGYDILPLSDAGIPEYMTKETALQNLLKEALYYGLGELQDMIEALTQEQTVVEVEETGKCRRYKLAECDRLGHWHQDDISESGFQFICSRMLAQPNLRLRLPQGLEHEGFKVVLGWMEGTDGFDSSTFALLESAN
ncbi:hypothetical protein CPB86DRAFT_789393 [Serendipita vermifera]|nr:hypothetical protein CPB86DRAFT_789393 [Serendipita vermifera]